MHRFENSRLEKANKPAESSAAQHASMSAFVSAVRCAMLDQASPCDRRARNSSRVEEGREERGTSRLKSSIGEAVVDDKKGKGRRG